MVLRRSSSEGMIKLAVSDKNLFIKFGMYRLSTVLIEGQFPSYQKVIPDSQKYDIKLKRTDLLDALKRVSIFVEQKSRRTFFSISEGKIVLSSEESDVGTAREEIPCDYAGPDAVIAMNYKYIEEPLRVIDSDDILMRYTETGRAITVSPEPAQDYFHILMPMQVD